MRSKALILENIFHIDVMSAGSKTSELRALKVEKNLKNVNLLLLSGPEIIFLEGFGIDFAF